MPAEGKPLCFKDVFLEGLPGNITNMTPRSAPPAHIGSPARREMECGAVFSAAQRQPGPGSSLAKFPCRRPKLVPSEAVCCRGGPRHQDPAAQPHVLLSRLFPKSS